MYFGKVHMMFVCFQAVLNNNITKLDKLIKDGMMFCILVFRPFWKIILYYQVGQAYQGQNDVLYPCFQAILNNNGIMFCILVFRQFWTIILPSWTSWLRTEWYFVSLFQAVLNNNITKLNKLIKEEWFLYPCFQAVLNENITKWDKLIKDRMMFWSLFSVRSEQ